uniref:ABC transmembrane type-1 domain-containing protein n=1 Tax=Octopus bimaculoides TaxID=37653 RepID=A0A0L8HU32_OCTBM
MMNKIDIMSNMLIILIARSLTFRCDTQGSNADQKMKINAKTKIALKTSSRPLSLYSMVSCNSLGSCRDMYLAEVHIVIVIIIVVIIIITIVIIVIIIIIIVTIIIVFIVIIIIVIIVTIFIIIIIITVIIVVIVSIVIITTTITFIIIIIISSSSSSIVIVLDSLSLGSIVMLESHNRIFKGTNAFPVISFFN